MKISQVDRSPISVAVLSCGGLGVEVANRLAGLEEVCSVALVTTPYRMRERRGLDRVRHLIRHDGLRGIPLAAGRRMRRLLFPSRAVDPDPFSGLVPGVVRYHFDDFHSPECLEKLRSLGPDLGVLAGVYILRENVFEIPRLGSINLHSGKVPEYRGSAPAFWELYNGEEEVGITVHRVTADLDAGAVVRQEVFPLDPAPPGDPLDFIARYREDVLRPNGVRLLVQSVRDIATDRAEPVSQDSSRARTWRSPRHADSQELRRRVRARRRASAVGARRGWKRLVKTGLGWTLYRTGLYRLWFRNRAMILLFHRVDDEPLENPLTCSSPAFDTFCGFLSRYFDVISLSQLLDLLERGESLDRRLVITFDDGYSDNREKAAPILRQHGLTACFFITTDLIGTAETAWWDAEIGVRSRWMDWSDVRDLAGMGFEIAAHTRTHVDLGTVGGEEALAEIEGSGLRLRSELGHEIPLFSYPFGRRENITGDARRYVRETGFRCCCSAYGGDVRPGSDPFDLRRLPVERNHRSPWQLGFELLYERLPVEPAVRKPPRDAPRERALEAER